MAEWISLYTSRGISLTPSSCLIPSGIGALSASG
jgi:hypothetical protein